MRYRKNLGDAGEEATCKYLQKQKIKVLARNYYTRYGEIDIVADDHGTLVFVEVKTRTSTAFGSGVEAIDYKKKQALFHAATAYASEHGLLDASIRFDVSSVLKDQNGYHIDYIQNIEFEEITGE